MIRVLVEGTSDVPTVAEIFVRGFGYVQGTNFQVHWHRGKGRLPVNPSLAPTATEQSLLGQLPAKLRAFGKSDKQSPVIVLLDADRDNLVTLTWQIYRTIALTQPRPDKVIVRIDVEEIEYWFITDTAAVLAAYPLANIGSLVAIPPDAVVGAWEALARALGLNPQNCTGADKEAWAKAISPHLKLDYPASPSFNRFVRTLEQLTGVMV
jgi:hypothetical protein